MLQVVHACAVGAVAAAIATGTTLHRVLERSLLTLMYSDSQSRSRVQLERSAGLVRVACLRAPC
jgi:hypothetical protein